MTRSSGHRDTAPAPTGAWGDIVRIETAALRRIHEHAREVFPEEAVGLLGGAREPPVVTTIVPLPNESRLPRVRHVAVTHAALARGLDELTGAGDERVGFYHSHCGEPARPSGRDRARLPADGVHLIVAVRPRALGPVTAWRLEPDREPIELRLEVVGE